MLSCNVLLPGLAGYHFAILFELDELVQFLLHHLPLFLQHRLFLVFWQLVRLVLRLARVLTTVDIDIDKDTVGHRR